MDHSVSASIIELLDLFLIRHAIAKNPVNRYELSMRDGSCGTLGSPPRFQSLIPIPE